MILDKQNMFSEAQAVTALGNTLSTNTIDLGVAGTPVVGGLITDVGRGGNVEVVAQVVTAFTSGGAATLQVQLVMADDAALTSNLTVLDETAAIALASLVAGYQFRMGTIPGGVTKRYLGIRYIVGTAVMTAGAVTAGLAKDRPSAQATL
jgi:hypothetical protein